MKFKLGESVDVGSIYLHHWHSVFEISAYYVYMNMERRLEVKVPKVKATERTPVILSVISNSGNETQILELSPSEHGLDKESIAGLLMQILEERFLNRNA